MDLDIKNKPLTEFNILDKIVNLEQSGVILLTGDNADILSGDIANNICLNQKREVLEIVSCKKEYLIKRLLVNKANVNYRNWTLKEEYTKQELEQIGQATVNLIEVTNRLPTIIEQDMNLYNLKNVVKLVSDFANEYADRETVSSLVVLDIFPLNKKYELKSKQKNEIINFFKKISKISRVLNLPIIIIYNKINNHHEYIKKEDLKYIHNLNKCIDTLIILNFEEKQQGQNTNTYIVDIYNKNTKIGTGKIKYDFEHRKFVN